MNHEIKVIGDYEVHFFQLIGQGSYGKVFEGRIISTDRKICVKILHQTDEKKQMIQRELQIMQSIKKITHPNIVKIYHVAQQNQRIYIFMEKCLENLEQMLQKLKSKDMKLTIEEVLEIAKQICRGYLEIKKQNIIHRDLKPENILVGEDGYYKICDYGLSKTQDDIESMMKQTQLGTPLFVSPQVFQGEYSNKADIFSLGMTIYYILFQKHFFSIKTIHDLKQEYNKIKNGVKLPAITNQGDEQLKQQLEYFFQQTISYEEEDRIGWDELNQYLEQLDYNRSNASRKDQLKVNNNLSHDYQGLTRIEKLEVSPVLYHIQSSQQQQNQNKLNSNQHKIQLEQNENDNSNHRYNNQGFQHYQIQQQDEQNNHLSKSNILTKINLVKDFQFQGDYGVNNQNNYKDFNLEDNQKYQQIYLKQNQDKCNLRFQNQNDQLNQKKNVLEECLVDFQNPKLNQEDWQCQSYLNIKTQDNQQQTNKQDYIHTYQDKKQADCNLHIPSSDIQDCQNFMQQQLDKKSQNEQYYQNQLQSNFQYQTNTIKINQANPFVQNICDFGQSELKSGMNLNDPFTLSDSFQGDPLKSQQQNQLQIDYNNLKKTNKKDQSVILGKQNQSLSINFSDHLSSQNFDQSQFDQANFDRTYQKTHETTQKLNSGILDKDGINGKFEYKEENQQEQQKLLMQDLKPTFEPLITKNEFYGKKQSEQFNLKEDMQNSNRFKIQEIQINQCELQIPQNIQQQQSSQVNSNKSSSKLIKTSQINKTPSQIQKLVEIVFAKIKLAENVCESYQQLKYNQKFVKFQNLFESFNYLLSQYQYSMIANIRLICNNDIQMDKCQIKKELGLLIAGNEIQDYQRKNQEQLNELNTIYQSKIQISAQASQKLQNFFDRKDNNCDLIDLVRLIEKQNLHQYSSYIQLFAKYFSTLTDKLNYQSTSFQDLRFFGYSIKFIRTEQEYPMKDYKIIDSKLIDYLTNEEQLLKDYIESNYNIIIRR